jgi:hypothetical protein
MCNGILRQTCLHCNNSLSYLNNIYETVLLVIVIDAQRVVSFCGKFAAAVRFRDINIVQMIKEWGNVKH